MKDENGNLIVDTTAVEAPDLLKVANEHITKVELERDNYKKVALKRLGKLPGDADFLEGADLKTGLTVEEQVAKALLDGEYKRLSQEKEAVITKMAKENSELRLALKNTPNSTSIGGGSSEGIEVKDNMITAEQRASLVATATRLKVDPEKFIEKFKANIIAKR